MRHLLRTTLVGRPSSEKYLVIQPVLELNPSHQLVRYLYQLVDSDITSGKNQIEDNILATALIDYLLDAGMAHAGLLDENREMVSRSSQLLTLLSERAAAASKKSE